MRSGLCHLAKLVSRHRRHEVWLRREERRLRLTLGNDWVERRLA